MPRNDNYSLLSGGRLKVSSDRILLVMRGSEGVTGPGKGFGIIQVVLFCFWRNIRFRNEPVPNRVMYDLNGDCVGRTTWIKRDETKIYDTEISYILPRFDTQARAKKKKNSKFTDFFFSKSGVICIIYPIFLSTFITKNN